MVQKEGNWMPYKLKETDMERRLVICKMLHQRQQRKGFLHRIITGDEKWIYYDNPKRLKAWVMPSEPGPSTSKYPCFEDYVVHLVGSKKYYIL